MRMKTLLCCGALSTASAAAAFAQDANQPSGDLAGAVNDALYMTPTNNTRHAFQNPTRMRAAGEDFRFDLDSGVDWSRSTTHAFGEDKDVEFGATVTGIVDPRLFEDRDDPSSHSMALLMSVTGIVGQDDEGEATATRDDVSFDGALRRDFGKFNAEIGAGYEVAPHFRNDDTFRCHAEAFTTIDLCQGKPLFSKSTFTGAEWRDESKTCGRRLTPFVGIEETIRVHEHGDSGRDYGLYYGVTYTHCLPQGFSFGVKPWARWDHDLHRTESAIRGSITHSVRLFRRDCDVSLFCQFGHGTGHDTPQTAVVGLELEMNL
jgi:hypothetical protein